MNFKEFNLIQNNFLKYSIKYIKKKLNGKEQIKEIDITIIPLPTNDLFEAEVDNY